MRGIHASPRLKLADQLAQPPLAVWERGGLVERLPVGGPDALALPLGELGEQVPEAIDVMPTSA